LQKQNLPPGEQKYFLPNSETFDETLFPRLPTLVRHIPRAVTTGGGDGGGTPPNVVILQFCRTVLTILTIRSSGKKYVIKQKILHNLLKSDSCRKCFDKFTKILLKNCPNYGTLVRKLVKNSMSEIFSSLPPFANDFGKRNIN
jgi:hypothetical protein